MQRKPSATPALGRFQRFVDCWMPRCYPRHRLLPWLACLSLVGALLSATGTNAVAASNPLRTGFSSKIFTALNPNDALAAVKVWVEAFAREKSIPMSPTPLILEGVAEIRQALRNQEVDALSLPIDEYWRVREFLDLHVFFSNGTDGKIFEEYVLLVHQDSDIQRLDDLRGRSLNFMQSFQMSLASIWLDKVLLQSGFPQVSEFCRVIHHPNLSKALLPVFFRQIDACVVTRTSFRTMSELNPQISRHLKVLASSPGLVTSGFTFRRGYNGPIRETIIAELPQMMTYPAGRQIMKLFKSEGFSVQPISCLDSAFELLAAHERLLGKTTPNAASKLVAAPSAAVSPGNVSLK